MTGELANYKASDIYAEEPQGEYRKQTTPVGSFPPNSFGLYDMHGNVWEWCADDFHDNYNGAPTDGSAWIDSQQEDKNESYSGKKDEKSPYSVLRGGSWGNDPNNCRSAIRYFLNRRDVHNYYIGFRVVCVFGRTNDS